MFNWIKKFFISCEYKEVGDLLNELPRSITDTVGRSYRLLIEPKSNIELKIIYRRFLIRDQKLDYMDLIIGSGMWEKLDEIIEGVERAIKEKT